MNKDDDDKPPRSDERRITDGTTLGRMLILMNQSAVSQRYEEPRDEADKLYIENYEYVEPNGIPGVQKYKSISCFTYQCCEGDVPEWTLYKQACGYEAMLEPTGVYLVTKGDQTRTLYDALESGGAFDGALATREREPDAPNYTPRISGMLDMRQRPVSIALNLLKANAADPELTDRSTFYPAPPPPGLGYCITTYMGDGRPLPSFSGEPLILPCAGTAQDVLDTYWDALDRDNRVSLAVKEIPAQGGTSQTVLHNRFP